MDFFGTTERKIEICEKRIPSVLILSNFVFGIPSSYLSHCVSHCYCSGMVVCGICHFVNSKEKKEEMHGVAVAKAF